MWWMDSKEHTSRKEMQLIYGMDRRIFGTLGILFLMPSFVIMMF